MADHVDGDGVADALLSSVSLLVRRISQLPTGDDLTMPERSALKLLERAGAATSAELARAAQISPQSMGVTVAALTDRGVVRRDRDSGDGRRVLLSVTPDGSKLLASKRDTRNQQMAAALGGNFTAAELQCLLAAAPLIERLARTI